MAIFKKGVSLEGLLEAEKIKNEFLTQQIEELKRQNQVLLETVVATKSPEAYRDMKADQATNANARTVSPEMVRAQGLRHKVQREWFDNLEGPTFRSADEFQDWLLKKNPPDDKDVESQALHPNTES